jgi:threonine synthase
MLAGVAGIFKIINVYYDPEPGEARLALYYDDAALRRLARNGLFVEPTSASAAAGLDRLAQEGLISQNESTVVVLSGSGLKAASAVADLVK